MQVVFGANAFIKEGKYGSHTSDYTLLASLTDLLSSEFVRYSTASNPLNAHFSIYGQNIYNSFSDLWNKDPEGNQVWSAEDLMPAYMVMQTQAERDYVLHWFNRIFGLEGQYTIENFLIG